MGGTAHGSYFPSWLLEPRRRAEQALVSVVVEAYVQGVSTRKVEDLVQALGIERMSKSQVSELAKTLDETVRSFRERPLLGTAKGRREVLGLDVVTSEDGAGWLAFIRSLVARGLSGVELVISDAHSGLKAAIASALPGASWQRFRTHFMRNLLVTVPKSMQGLVATTVRSIYAQPDADSVRAQHARVVEQLTPRFPKAATMLADAIEDLLAFTHFPKEHWRQIWSNNPQERLNREIRRRSDVVGIFPNRDSLSASSARCCASCTTIGSWYVAT